MGPRRNKRIKLSTLSRSPRFSRLKDSYKMKIYGLGKISCERMFIIEATDATKTEGVAEEDITDYHLQSAIKSGSSIPIPETIAIDESAYSQMYPPSFQRPDIFICTEPAPSDGEKSYESESDESSNGQEDVIELDEDEDKSYELIDLVCDDDESYEVKVKDYERKLKTKMKLLKILQQLSIYHEKCVLKRHRLSEDIIKEQSTAMLSQRVLVSTVIGTLVRFALFFAGFGSIMQKRVEVSTPTNSWLAVQEGVYLMSKRISPYYGDTVHETPLALLLAYELIKISTPLMIFIYFVLVDILTATLLGYAADKFKDFYLMKSQKNSKHTKSQNGVDLLVKPDDPYGASVFMAYYVNPFIIASCLGQTTTVLVNFFLALAVFGMADGFFWLLVIGLCGATYQSFYPMVLIFPACICIYNKYCARNIDGKAYSHAYKLFQLVRIIVSILLATVGGYVLLLNISSGHFGWGFLDRTYGFILNVRDLKPNIGLFWYFFTEMFEHFHLLFICTFQINAFIYVIPLTVRFYDEPPLLVYGLCTLMTIFKSYPSVGDVGFYLSFLPMWSHIFPFMQQKFLVGCFFIATTVLAPIQWYLWIYSGSANANFYFGVTIAFGTAQIFLLTDILLAHLKREYFLQHGVQKSLNGKPVGLSLT